MTIVKSSENFTINDSLENGWTIQGNMNISENETSINLYINNNQNSDQKDMPMNTTEVGNYFWRKSDRINVSYSAVKEEYENTILEACKNIVTEALASSK